MVVVRCFLLAEKINIYPLEIVESQNGLFWFLFMPWFYWSVSVLVFPFAISFHSIKYLQFCCVDGSWSCPLLISVCKVLQPSQRWWVSCPVLCILPAWRCLCAAGPACCCLIDSLIPFFLEQQPHLMLGLILHERQEEQWVVFQVHLTSASYSAVNTILKVSKCHIVFCKVLVVRCI